MNIDEAITIIQADVDDGDVDWGSPLGKAYKLAYEALKEVKASREEDYIGDTGLLPGETEK